MTGLPRASRIDRNAAPAADHIDLTHEARFLRRKRLTAASGLDFLADLAEVTDLHDGDAFVLDDGTRVTVRAAPERLMEVTGPNLARLAWHVGNRHTPCEIGETALRLKADHVLRGMLEGLGGTVSDVVAPFRPEGGAYGHGRTLAHSHGPGDGDADHHHNYHD
ncbi:urease accessory protein [Tranquillimonas rosea]|uniref:Urease accessory protein UreE n=1 Tax=Tranquillimonas rosea TaxID=641238 RepID=A0A1H9V4V7_9RHOB|nr:urease accessory protein UreE [Tranquillimonas rosea]SES16581.1 urease accessory protein [Tranquillimonas rosea]